MKMTQNKDLDGKASTLYAGMSRRAFILSLIMAAGAAVFANPYSLVRAQGATSDSQSKESLESRIVNKPDLRVGDKWVYNVGYNNEKVEKTIRSIKDDKVEVVEPNNCNLDTLTYTPSWGKTRGCAVLFGKGSKRTTTFNYTPPLQYTPDMPFEVRPGKTWKLEYKFGSDPNSLEGKAIGWETITVPAGTYEALKIEVSLTSGLKTGFKYTLWYAPAANNFIKQLLTQEPQENFELVSYTKG